MVVIPLMLRKKPPGVTNTPGGHSMQSLRQNVGRDLDVTRCVRLRDLKGPGG